MADVFYPTTVIPAASQIITFVQLIGLHLVFLRPGKNRGASNTTEACRPFILKGSLFSNPVAIPAQVDEYGEKILIDLYSGERTIHDLSTTLYSQRVLPESFKLEQISSHARFCKATFASHIPPSAAVTELQKGCA